MFKVNLLKTQMIRAKTNLILNTNKFFSVNESKNFERENIFTYLNNRKLIANISHQELLAPGSKIDSFLKEDPRMYIGFDPTAESLHLGNLIGILTAIRFAAFGIEPIFVLGGATGQIGDPSGKNKERPLLQKEKIENNLAMIEENIKNVLDNIKDFSEIKIFCKLHKQSKLNKKSKNKSSSGSDEEEKPIDIKLKKINEGFNKTYLTDEKMFNNFLKTMEMAKKENIIEGSKIYGEDLTYQIVNNHVFYKDLNIIDFLREAGVNLRMGPLLSRDTVKNRLNTKEGLSLTEFMYQAFQGYDFLKLYENYNVKIQIGGSDQWGNMLAGYELIKKMKNTEVVNMTFPLMTTSSGQKFGKSEGNAIFLNPKLSPINSVYQYYYNLADADLMKMFSAFTFVETAQIDEILEFHNKCPEKRNGQKMLAEKIVSMLFTEEEANKCKNSCQAHYLNCNKLEDLESALKDCHVNEISEESLEKNLSISNLCFDHKILPTKTQCRRLIQSGSLFINDSKISEDVVIKKEMFLNGKYMVLKTGKKHTHIFQIKSKESLIIDNTNLNVNMEMVMNNALNKKI